VSAAREGTQFIDEGLVPITCDQLDEAMLALRGKGIGAPFLIPLFALGANRITPQLTREISSLEFASLSRVLWDPDAGLFAVPAGGCLYLVLELGGTPTATDDIDDVSRSVCG
jgi:hypothetical protein